MVTDGDDEGGEGLADLGGTGKAEAGPLAGVDCVEPEASEWLAVATELEAGPGPGRYDDLLLRELSHGARFGSQEL